MVLLDERGRRAPAGYHRPSCRTAGHGRRDVRASPSPPLFRFSGFPDILEWPTVLVVGPRPQEADNGRAIRAAASARGARVPYRTAGGARRWHRRLPHLLATHPDTFHHPGGGPVLGPDRAEEAGPSARRSGLRWQRGR